MGNTHRDVFKCCHLQYGQRMKHMPVETSDRPIVVGIAGASGVIYGVRLLELLRACDIKTHLIVSRAAQMTLAVSNLQMSSGWPPSCTPTTMSAQRAPADRSQYAAW